MKYEVGMVLEYAVIPGDLWKIISFDETNHVWMKNIYTTFGGPFLDNLSWPLISLSNPKFWKIHKPYERYLKLKKVYEKC